MLLYKLIKAWVWLSLRLFFNDVNVEGKENVPKNKGIIFFANHFNTLLDPLLIVTAFSKKTWFLTRADVFKSERNKKVLHFFGAFATYRSSDGFKAPLQNKGTFDFCSKILSNAGWISLFPEGTHGQSRTLKPFKKGIMRIWENNKEALCIPVALNFSSLTSPNSRIDIRFSQPISYCENLQATDLRSELEKEIIVNPYGKKVDEVLDLDWGRKHRKALSNGRIEISEDWKNLADFFGDEIRLVKPFKFGLYIGNMVYLAALLPLSIAGLILELPYRLLCYLVFPLFKDKQFHLAIAWLLKHFYTSIFFLIWCSFLLTKGLISFYTIGLLFMLVGLAVLPIADRQLKSLMGQLRFLMLSKGGQEKLEKLLQLTVYK